MEKMELRDYLAVKAMQGLTGELNFRNLNRTPQLAEELSKAAYTIADAMILEKNK